MRDLRSVVFTALLILSCFIASIKGGDIIMKQETIEEKYSKLKLFIAICCGFIIMLVLYVLYNGTDVLWGLIYMPLFYGVIIGIIILIVKIKERISKR